MSFQIIWNDEDLLAVNKLSGLRTIPDGYDPSLPHLASLLMKDYGRVWVVHRLDKDTSGIILFARNATAHRALNLQFEQRKTKKEYHAICVGMPEWDTLSIDLPLSVDGDRKHRTIIDHQTGKTAETEASVLQQLGLFALVAAAPYTGYTHQIRAHLAALALPILNDRLYKSLKPDTEAQVQARQVIPTLPIQRLALHAYRITIKHPVTGETLSLQAPYQDDFQDTITKLREDKPSTTSD